MTGKRTLHDLFDPSPRCPRILEIGFQPLFHDVFPDMVTFIDTRLRCSSVRDYQVSQASLAEKMQRLTSIFMRAARLALNQDYDLVITRCLGPVNSYGRPWWHHFFRCCAGWALEGLVRFAARAECVGLRVLDQTDHGTIHPRDRRSAAGASDLYFKRELADNLWRSLETMLPSGACAGILSSILWVSLAPSYVRYRWVSINPGFNIQFQALSATQY